jgi:hypothetical protein
MMPTVRLRDASEYPEPARQLFELSKQWFNSSYTKIADTLQLPSDMGGIAPEEASPAPGGGR